MRKSEKSKRRNSRQSSRQNHQRRLILETLEPRMLLAGCVVESSPDNNNYHDQLDPAQQLVPVEDALAPGLKMACATGSIVPATTTGYWSDPDYWAFHALEGDRVSIRVDTPPSSKLDPYVQLRNINNVKMLEADSNDGPGNDAFISAYRIPADGIYYVLIGKEVGNTVSSSNSSAYELYLDVASGISMEQDAGNGNDTTGNSLIFTENGGTRTVTVAGVVTALDSKGMDEDRFKLESLNEGNVVELQIKLPESSTLVPRLRVVDANDNVLSDQDGDPYDNHFWAEVPADGEYYAEVAGYWSLDNHRYTPILTAMTWDDANALAGTEGGHLAFVDSNAENEWLADNFTPYALNKTIFLGLEYDAGDGTPGSGKWTWTDGQEPAATYWASHTDAENYHGVLSTYYGEPDWFTLKDSEARYAVAEFEVPGDSLADAQPGSLARYVLDIAVRDVVPPAIVSINEFPDADGTTDEIISSFQVNLSEDLDTDSANTLSNWDLRAAGLDGEFGTSDDASYSLAVSPAYAGGTSVSLSVTNGPLDEGLYKFTAAATLSDASGNLLDGNGDGAAGDAYERTFTVDFNDLYTFEGRANGTRLTATSLPLNEDPDSSGFHLGFGQGAIDPTSDEDWWSFGAEAGDLVGIAMDPQAGVLQAKIELYDAAGNSLRVAQYGSGPDNGAYISHYLVPDNGTYYVHARGFGGSAGKYTLRVELAQGIDLESDTNYANNTVAQELSLQASDGKTHVTVAGTIMASDSASASTDVDRFALGPWSSGNAIELQVQLPSTSTLVPYLRVVDADGNELADTDGDPTDGHFRASITNTGETAYFAELSGYWIRGENRYLPTRDALGRVDAEALANDLGGHLVAVNDQEENQWLVDQFMMLGSFWLGLHDIPADGGKEWIWTSGEVFDYSHWYPGGPYDATPNTTSLTNGVLMSTYRESTPYWHDWDENLERIGIIEAPSDVTDGQPGTLAQYLLDVTVFDLVPPTISAVDRFPAEGGQTDEIISSFQVTASEWLDPATVNNPDNWELFEAGPDGLLNTNDDVAYTLVIQPAYTDGTEVAISISDGPLDEGHYGFRALPGLTDLSGNPLDGGAYEHTFHVDFPEPFVFEGTSNNTKVDATALPLVQDPAGSGYYLGFGIGSIDPDVDTDWWSFEAKGGDVVAIALDPQAGVLKPEIQLHDATGSTCVAQSTNDGPGDAAYISISRNEYEIPADGTYYIQAFQHAGEVDSYQLRVELGRDIDLESDANYSNNSESGADALSLNTTPGKKTATVGGTIMASEGATKDVDLYSLGSLAAGNELVLDVSLPTYSTAVPYLRVLDSNLNPLEDGDLSDPSFAAVIQTDGIYYAEVSTYWTRDGHRYLPTPTEMTWSGAENLAISLGGHLATVSTAEEDQWLSDNFLNVDVNSVWIGLNDVETEGTWRWSSGELLGSYANWDPDRGEPNGGALDDGVVLSNYYGTPYWYDIRSTSLRYGIAELPTQAGDPDDGGPGTLAQYVLKTTILDSIDPQISDVSRLPDEGGTTDEVFRSFRVTASEKLDVAAAATPDNWDLRATGPDGVFDTGDDVVYPLSPSTAAGDGSIVDLSISGFPLQEGQYRFTAAADLTDDFGNPLDGDGDGTSGDAYQLTFYVGYPDSYVFENADNDTLANATSLRLVEDPYASGYHTGRGIGSIDPASDEDWWSFPAKQGDLVAIALDPDTDDLVAGIEVYDAGGTWLIADADADGDGPDQAAYISHYPIPADGTYYIRADYLSGDPGLYQVRVELARGIDLEADARYANNTLGGANTITSWTEQDGASVARVAGTIMGDESSTVDVDVYRLGTIQAGERVVANIRLPATSLLEPQVEIWDSSGTMVSTAVSPHLVAAAADVDSTETYYAVVRGLDGAGPHGQYVMDLSHEPSTAVGYADLVVTQISAPSTARGGQTISVGWTVANWGAATDASSSWRDYVILSTNEILGDDGDIQVFRTRTGGLAADGTYTVSAEVDLPFLHEAAEYHVFVVVDRFDIIEEGIFEYNNTAQSDGGLKLPAPMQVLDLIDVSPDPRNVPLAEFEVEFSEPIDPATLTGKDLTLQRNNWLLDADVPLIVTAVTDTRYRISGLESLTAAGGQYNLEVNAWGISIPAGVHGEGTAADTWLMDVTPPNSRVDSLPDVATSLEIEVSVSGGDFSAPGTLISGVDYYEIYVSVNQTPFTLWRTVPAGEPVATYQSQSSTMLAFHSVAYDKAGNRENEPTYVDTRTIVPDLTPPESAVISVDTRLGMFQVAMQGTDVGSSLDFFNVYVEIDEDVIHHFATIPAGEPDAEGVHHSTAQYQAITDGQMHSYRFYTIGEDIAGNSEETPSQELDIIVEAGYSTQSVLEITEFDVQRTANQRSFLRYVDVLFGSAEGVDTLVGSVQDSIVDNDRIRLVNLDVAPDTPIDLSDAAHLVGQSLALDFGVYGIGGSPNSPIGNGRYELAFDLNDDGQFSSDEKLEFFRLYGDANGDGVVDYSDYVIVRSQYGRTGNNLDADMNGDGRVNFSDIRAVYGQFGATL